MSQICKDLFAFPEAVIGKKKNVFVSFPAEPEKPCVSVCQISWRTAPSPRCWRTTPPPSAGWPSWSRTCRKVKSPMPEASRWLRSEPAAESLHKRTGHKSQSLRFDFFFFQCSSVFKVKTFDEIEVLLLSRFVSTGFGSRYIKSTWDYSEN